MITAADAEDLIRTSVRRLAPRPVSLADALGRVLAEEVVADLDVPGFDNASMDGYALAVDGTGHGPRRSYAIIGEAAAGRPFTGEVREGEAVRIMTGGPLPRGAECVIEVEKVRESADAISFDEYPASGRHIRRTGEDIRRGTAVLHPGMRLRPAHLGVLASMGRATVSVTPAPHVAVVSTGTELVAPGQALAHGQIHNSSAFVVPALLREARAEVTRVETVNDDPAMLRASIGRALSDDLLITTGGVSAGKHDLVLDVLQQLGVEVIFWKVRIKPGMPLAFGRSARGVPVVCLPGNPVSTAVTFQQFVHPVLDALQGAAVPSTLRGRARLEHEISKKDRKRHFNRGVALFHNGEWRVRTTGPQSSGILTSLVLANCLIIVPEDVEHLAAGESVEIEWL
jgi:molybdopterin molybdotransferase